MEENLSSEDLLFMMKRISTRPVSYTHLGAEMGLDFGRKARRKNVLTFSKPCDSIVANMTGTATGWRKCVRAFVGISLGLRRYVYGCSFLQAIVQDGF